MYGSAVDIPNTFVAGKGEIKGWFTMKKDKIIDKSDESMKVTVLSEYYKDIYD